MIKFTKKIPEYTTQALRAFETVMEDSWLVPAEVEILAEIKEELAKREENEKS